MSVAFFILRKSTPSAICSRAFPGFWGVHAPPTTSPFSIPRTCSRYVQSQAATSRPGRLPICSHGQTTSNDDQRGWKEVRTKRRIKLDQAGMNRPLQSHETAAPNHITRSDLNLYNNSTTSPILVILCPPHAISSSSSCSSSSSSSSRQQRQQCSMHAELLSIFNHCAGSRTHVSGFTWTLQICSESQALSPMEWSGPTPYMHIVLFKSKLLLSYSVPGHITLSIHCWRPNVYLLWNGQAKPPVWAYYCPNSFVT